MDQVFREAVLAAYRQKFRESPVGKWRSEMGTFALMSECWLFRDDGTGEQVSESGSGTETVPFRWEQRGPAAVALLFDEEEEWFELHYDFKWVRTDVSEVVTLCITDGVDFFAYYRAVVYEGDKSWLPG